MRADGPRSSRYALRQGALCFLTKPVNSEDLDTVFERARKMIETDSKELLIVEDDEDLREMMAQLLTLEGFQTATVANGREALESTVAANAIAYQWLPELGGRRRPSPQ